MPRDFQKYLLKAFKIFSVLLLLPAACQSNELRRLGDAAASVELPQSCAASLQTPGDEKDYYAWDSTHDFSQPELQAIKSLRLVSENLHVRTTSGGYRRYAIPGSKLMQEQLLNGKFRSILPIQNVDGWNLFVAAERFAPDSNFIRSFVLLIEGAGGWQSRYLFPAPAGEGTEEGNTGNYLGGYDIAIYSMDLNYNGRKELIFVSHTGGKGSQISCEILQLRQDPELVRLQFEPFEIPRLHSFRAEFKDNFLVSVQLEEQNSPTLIRRLPLARRQNLDYGKNGKWLGGNARPRLDETPNHIQPMEWRCNDIRYRLLYTEQPLKGLANADTIGYYQSFWVLQADEEDLVDQELAGASSADALAGGSTILYWSLMENRFQPFQGNELFNYESLLP